jgi:ATP-dependent DNA helicase RecG
VTSIEDIVLTSNDRALASIHASESHFREFKSALQGTPNQKTARPARDISRDISEALVGFANADGGEILIGVEDDGTVTGVPHTNESLANIIEAPRSHVLASTPLPTPRVVKAIIEGKLVLIFAVEKTLGRVVQTSDGRCLIRRDRETIPADLHQINQSRTELKSREYDREFVRGATIADLDVTMVERLREVFGNLSAEKLLQQVGLAEFAAGNVRLRRAALLLFAQDIIRFHPRCEVRILRVNGTEVGVLDNYNVEELSVVRAPIIQLIEQAWEELRPHLTRTVYSNGKFSSRISYPEDACLEAIVNSIVHRDYSLEGQGVEVYIFDDRLEIKSPGGLLSSISLDSLRNGKGAHDSRNTGVARVLKEIGFVREMGEGMRRIFRSFADKDLTPPEIAATDNSFAMRFYHRSVYSPAAQRWLEAYDLFNLTRSEKQVVLLGQQRQTIHRSEILKAAGIKTEETERYRALIEGLQLKGILATSDRGRKGYSVRPPEDCERDRRELVDVISGLGPMALAAPNRIPALLPQSNALRGKQMSRVLGALGLTS